ncbi:thioredoxin family protein [Clostridium sp. B9]|uniref:thioredoxin family protein n=1 Tax=Clostridium sp. B9 TaxID=3423224 RepID=UPI003D2F2EE4
MRRILNLLLVVLLTFTFIGCGNKEYERDTSSGEKIIVSLDEALAMATDEEAIILLGRPTCRDCLILEDILVSYLEDHKITIYEVNLDNEGTSEEEIQRNRNKINKVFPDFNSTPSMYYVKSGKIIDEIIEASSEEELDKWVVKNRLDAK